MEDYRSNSHKAKAEAKEAAEKKVDKVVTGNVKRKKKSEVSKFKDVFISEDVSNVKRSIYGDYKDCDINIENDGKYVGGTYKCGCKIRTN